MQITLKDEVIQFLNECYPIHLCQSYDKVGQEIANTQDISAIMITLEVTQDVVLEAIEKKANFIICHHPLFFSPLESIDLRTSKGQMLANILKHDICIFSIHTNADAAIDGLGYKFAQLLRLQNFKPLLPIDEKTGIGGIGQLEFKTDFLTFIDYIKKTFSLEHVKVVGEPKDIHSVAFVNGSGQSAWAQAKAMSADVFLSGDIGYHSAQDALNEGMLLIELPHYEEYIFCEMISKQLASFTNKDIYITTKLRDPFSYY